MQAKQYQSPKDPTHFINLYTDIIQQSEPMHLVDQINTLMQHPLFNEQAMDVLSFAYYFRNERVIIELLKLPIIREQMASNRSLFTLCIELPKTLQQNLSWPYFNIHQIITDASTDDISFWLNTFKMIDQCPDYLQPKLLHALMMRTDLLKHLASIGLFIYSHRYQLSPTILSHYIRQHNWTIVHNILHFYGQAEIKHYVAHALHHHSIPLLQCIHNSTPEDINGYLIMQSDIIPPEHYMTMAQASIPIKSHIQKKMPYFIEIFGNLLIRNHHYAYWNSLITADNITHHGNSWLNTALSYDYPEYIHAIAQNPAINAIVQTSDHHLRQCLRFQHPRSTAAFLSYLPEQSLIHLIDNYSFHQYPPQFGLISAMSQHYTINTILHFLKSNKHQELFQVAKTIRAGNKDNIYLPIEFSWLQEPIRQARKKPSFFSSLKAKFNRRSQKGISSVALTNSSS